ncbi:uncharacterized protein LOC132030576 [Lycium ferocissimum]|uniref:uncharacterized protein LOC132030576 n=1 Tax=Lycium ferocissimum TaxID=112874 RepID=UPI0028153E64|nr:uncharacterized protein LOC132030576 [Lycium ferocissimum]
MNSFYSAATYIKMANSGQLLQHSLWSKPEFRHSRHVPPLKTNHESVMKVSQRKLQIRGIKSKPNCLVTYSMLNPQNGTDMGTFSPSDTITKFYTSINNKDMNQLALLIDKDCFFDDFSYTRPFRGRKEALKFLEQLTTCMGKNTEFCIEHIYEGVDLTTVVNWHLEWNKKQLPFTRGCSCYELSRDGEELVIRKAQVIAESPIKPGSLALEVFQKVISVCDAFPETAEWFLAMSPKLLLSIYNILIIPIWASIGPFFAWYHKLWRIIVTIVTLIYTIFLFIVDKLHK